MTTSRGRGGFFRPSQTEQVEGGIGRILGTVKWISIWGMCFLFLLFVDALIVGPWVGWAIGLLMILYLFKPACLYMLDIRDIYASLVISSVMIGILLFYAIVGYPAFEREWPPYHPLPIPLWLGCVILVISFFLKLALGWGIWGMWIELIDPFGPAAPRIAVARDGIIYPFGKHKETYGGARLPPVEREPLPPIMPYRRIKLMLVDEGNHLMAFADIEDSPRMLDFAKAIKAGKSFSERTARGVGPRDLGFSRRDWIVEIREPFLNREWAEWKDKEHPEQGVQLLPEGYDFWVELANESFEED